MAKKWRSEEFIAKETVIGHGRESIRRQVCDFLNKNEIQEGSAVVTCYLDADIYGANTLNALVFYRK